VLSASYSMHVPMAIAISVYRYILPYDQMETHVGTVVGQLVSTSCAPVPDAKQLPQQTPRASL